MEIQTALLSNMLKQVYLGKLIEECVIMSTEEALRVIAIDKTSSIYVNVTVPLSFGQRSIGVGDISTLSNYLESVENGKVAVSVQDNRMVFTSGNTNFRYLMTAAENIVTQLKDIPTNNEDYDKMMLLPYTVPLTEEVQQQFLRMSKLTKPRAITLKMGRKGRVTIDAGIESEHKFDMVVGMCEQSAIPYTNTEIGVFGEHLTNVISVLLKGGEATLRLDNDASTLCIMQGTNFWVFQPLAQV